MNKIKEFSAWAQNHIKTHKKNNAEDVFLDLKSEIVAYLNEGFS